MQHEKILVLDFGGQYNQLIARRVRELNVYCEVHPSTMSIEKIKEFNPKGIIFTGGPNSVYLKDSPLIDKEIFGFYFDEVYWHPIYLSERLIVSHFPQAIWPGQCNLMGHCHGAIIDAPGYINCSINDTNFTAITDKHINSAFSKVGKFETKFLYEPWADMYKFTKRDTSDLVVDQNGKIDLAATRAYKKFQNDLTSK